MSRRVTKEVSELEAPSKATIRRSSKSTRARIDQRLVLLIMTSCLLCSKTIQLTKTGAKEMRVNL